MEEDVTDVLEEYFNTIAGVRQITSTTRQGVSQIAVEFELGTDLDVVVQEVRDKVAMARRELPFDLDPPVVGNFERRWESFPLRPTLSVYACDRCGGSRARTAGRR